MFKQWQGRAGEKWLCLLLPFFLLNSLSFLMQMCMQMSISICLCLVECNFNSLEMEMDLHTSNDASPMMMIRAIFLHRVKIYVKQIHIYFQSPLIVYTMHSHTQHSFFALQTRNKVDGHEKLIDLCKSI